MRKKGKTGWLLIPYFFFWPSQEILPYDVVPVALGSFFVVFFLIIFLVFWHFWFLFADTQAHRPSQCNFVSCKVLLLPLFVNDTQSLFCTYVALLDCFLFCCFFLIRFWGTGCYHRNIPSIAPLHGTRSNKRWLDALPAYVCLQRLNRSASRYFWPNFYSFQYSFFLFFLLRPTLWPRDCNRNSRWVHHMSENRIVLFYNVLCTSLFCSPLFLGPSSRCICFIQDWPSFKNKHWKELQRPTLGLCIRW